MATTVQDLQLSLAYRLGENSVPNNSNEKARRLSFINEGYRDVMRQHYWWFTEAITTFSSVANKEYYTSTDPGYPSDLRFPLEVRFQSVLYDQVQQDAILGSYNTPYTAGGNSYMIFNSRLYFVPPLQSAVVDGIAMKYYKNYTKLVNDTDTILIPDHFSDVLVAYAKGRIDQLASNRGSASDAFDEYNEILNLMVGEQNKYLFSLKYSENEFEPMYP